MANRKSVEPEQPPTAPLWVVTYSDLISLLVTFFVMLYTFSSMEDQPLRRVRGSLRGAFGAIAEPGEEARSNIEPTRVPPDAETDLRGVRKPPKRKELELDEYLRMFQSGVDVPVEVSGGGIRIRFAADDLYAPASTVVKPEGRRIASEMGEFLRSLPVRLVVEAHTDPVFHRMTRHEDATAMTWEMALNMSRLLVEETGWNPPRITIAAFGTDRPVADNGTPEGRERNRRVEFLVLPLEDGS